MIEDDEIIPILPRGINCVEDLYGACACPSESLKLSNREGPRLLAPYREIFFFEWRRLMDRVRFGKKCVPNQCAKEKV